VSVASFFSREGGLFLLGFNRLLRWIAGIDQLELPNKHGVEQLFMCGREKARAGELHASADLFSQAVALEPTFAEAIEWRGEVLDMLGQTDQSAADYEASRKARATAKHAAADRNFVLRQQRRFTAHIASYTAVIFSVQARVYPLIARGNAYLADGKADAALIDYQHALKLNPGLHQVIVLKGEALLMLERYEEALRAFEAAAVLLKDDQTMGGRAIAHFALGQLEAADADWRQQFELLPQHAAAARACVALRLADYEKALPELERAITKMPEDAYWPLYRMVALRRLNLPVPRPDMALSGAWPVPLIALQAGEKSVEDLLLMVKDRERRAEVMYQAAILAMSSEVARAKTLFAETIEQASPTTIEYAAARHELARLGA